MNVDDVIKYSWNALGKLVSIVSRYFACFIKSEKKV